MSLILKILEALSEFFGKRFEYIKKDENLNNENKEISEKPLETEEDFKNLVSVINDRLNK
jgi:cell shape-determining protein MreC